MHLLIINYSINFLDTYAAGSIFALLKCNFEKKFIRDIRTKKSKEQREYACVETRSGKISPRRSRSD